MTQGGLRKSCWTAPGRLACRPAPACPACFVLEASVRSAKYSLGEEITRHHGVPASGPVEANSPIRSRLGDFNVIGVTRLRPGLDNPPAARESRASFAVIPAKAGIQGFLRRPLDTGFRRYDGEAPRGDANDSSPLPPGEAAPQARVRGALAASGSDW